MINFLKRTRSFTRRYIKKSQLKAIKMSAKRNVLLATQEDFATHIFPHFSKNNADIIKKKLPGLLYGPLRNLGPWIYSVNKRIKSFEISLIANHAEVLNLNHIIFWVKNSQSELVPYEGDFDCTMSSCAKVLPDPNALMRGNRSNTVSIHSTREKKPWWRIEFSEPTHVEFVEIINRKDKWGSRFSSAILRGADDSGNVVYQYSNVNKNGYMQKTEEEFFPLVFDIVRRLQEKGNISVANELTTYFKHYLRKDAHEELRKLLLTTLRHASLQSLVKTPDIGTTEEQGLNLNLDPQKTYTKLRVTSYRRRLIREVKLKVKASSGAVFDLLETEKLEADNQKLLSLKKELWALPSEHVFETDLSLEGTNNITLWAADDFATDAIIIRKIEVSENGLQWDEVDSTLKDYKLSLDLLTLYEWIVGSRIDGDLVMSIGEFLSTYRMHMTRTYKNLLSGHNRALLPSYYQAVERGGATANYLPKVIYTRHGLSVPFAEQDSSFLALRMFEFSEFVEENFGLKCFPCYGTLLGIHRDDDFLPHDDDIDLAVVVDLPEGKTWREATMDWADKFSQVGVKCKPPTPNSINLHCYFKDCDMDLFFVYSSSSHPNHVMTHMEGYKIRKVKKALLQPESKIEFQGHTFYAPNNIEGFLEDRYGKGWVSPDPYFEL